jgi:hypothetical protein
LYDELLRNRFLAKSRLPGLGSFDQNLVLIIVVRPETSVDSAQVPAKRANSQANPAAPGAFIDP